MRRCIWCSSTEAPQSLRIRASPHRRFTLSENAISTGPIAHNHSERLQTDAMQTRPSHQPASAYTRIKLDNNTFSDSTIRISGIHADASRAARTTSSLTVAPHIVSVPYFPRCMNAALTRSTIIWRMSLPPACAATVTPLTLPRNPSPNCSSIRWRAHPRSCTLRLPE